MDRISGSYPGGPRRREEGEPPPPPTELDSVGDIEERSARLAVSRSRRRRSRRVRIGFLVAILASAGVGLALGLMSHRTSTELAGERRSRTAQGDDFNPSAQVNRMLLEMWKMESIEKEPPR